VKLLLTIALLYVCAALILSVPVSVQPWIQLACELLGYAR